MESHRTLWDSESKKQILRDHKFSQERGRQGKAEYGQGWNRVSHQTPWEERTTWAWASHNGFPTRPGWAGGGTLQAEKAFLEKAALQRCGVKACLISGGLLCKRDPKKDPEPNQKGGGIRRRSYSNTTTVKSHKEMSTKEDRRGRMTETRNLV